MLTRECSNSTISGLYLKEQKLGYWKFHFAHSCKKRSSKISQNVLILFKINWCVCLWNLWRNCKTMHTQKSLKFTLFRCWQCHRFKKILKDLWNIFYFLNQLIFLNSKVLLDNGKYIIKMFIISFSLSLYDYRPFFLISFFFS